MSGWYNAQAPYRAILSYIKSKGVRVYHREIKNGAGATFDCKKIIITIDKRYRDTWEGCYLACHEWIHFCQYREGKFKRFFKQELTEDDLPLVIEAEMDAVRRGVKLLKTWGIDYQPEELSEEGLEKSVKFWKKYYFDKKQ